MRKTYAGVPYPLGATFDGDGVNFALFSANAKKVELCLFSPNGAIETERYELTERDNDIWHIYVSGLKAGQVYGYRVYGEYKPQEGKRFNHNKLLFDPYGKKLVGCLILNKAIFGYDIDSPMKDLSFSNLDSAPYVPKSVVVDNQYDWKADKHPQTPFEKSVIYETHTKGFTYLHPKVKENERGKFAALASKSVQNYLKWLGITAVELLPIHAFFADKHNVKNTTKNYWGYESLSFFAPEPSYLSCDDIDEFRDMVRIMHKNGIEVLLDVVFNHTGEGNELGPTLCYRGIDNESYYTLNRDNPRYYYDSTGCGASFNLQNPAVMTLVMDSLRYWVNEMHVDGFRFDLAPTLARKNEEFMQDAPFLSAIRQDDVLRQVKLIAEPWDVGYGGYQLGAFPPNWAEWNDQYRDAVRKFFKGDERMAGVFASRISGSSDIFNYNNRKICSSINFVTAHDGFNLADLVSYNGKHNFANGEENRDGNSNNCSWNSGAEGETSDEMINELRQKRAKALISALMLSFGTPMMLAGDEFYRSMFGNNNPYCQDNILNWIAWDAIDMKGRNFARFVRSLINLRKKLKIFDRKEFFSGKIVKDTKHKDIIWYTREGTEFSQKEWSEPGRKTVSYCVYSDIRAVICIFNASADDIDWTLPQISGYSRWKLRLDSSGVFDEDQKLASGALIKVPAWSVLAIEIKK